MSREWNLVTKARDVSRPVAGIEREPADAEHLIFRLRRARRKARIAAVTEALCLLRDLEPLAPPGGPLSEQGGLFWVDIPRSALREAERRFPRLGYSVAVDRLEAVRSAGEARQLGNQLVRWRRRPYRLSRIYEEDAEAMRARAPDRREFVIETRDGVRRSVRGYRGDGTALGRRGLPVCDARLLVNLVFSPGDGHMFLDPFAGAGGILLEALVSGHRVLSSDIDPSLRHGCHALGAIHSVADGSRLSFASQSIDAIATEPPFDREAEGVVAGALGELHRVLRRGGRLAVLCAGWQAGVLRRVGASLGMTTFLDTPIDRKGTDCCVLAWQKGGTD